jgi:hypothetical protein
VTVQDTDIATFKHIAAFAVLKKVEHLVIGTATSTSFLDPFPTH